MKNLVSKAREKMNVVKLASSSLVVSSMVALCGVTAFAEDGSTSAESVLESSFTSIGDSLVSMVGTILPIALSVLSVVLVVTFGIKLFKKIIGKGT